MYHPINITQIHIIWKLSKKYVSGFLGLIGCLGFVALPKKRGCPMYCKIRSIYIEKRGMKKEVCSQIGI